MKCCGACDVFMGCECGESGWQIKRQNEKDRDEIKMLDKIQERAIIQKSAF